MIAVKGDVAAVKEKVGQAALDFVSFKAKLETTLGFLRWLGAFVATLLVAVIYSVISAAHTAGQMESNINHQKELVNEQKDLIKDYSKLMQEQPKQIGMLSSRIDEMSTQLTEIRTFLLKNRPKTPE